MKKLGLESNFNVNFIFLNQILKNFGDYIRQYLNLLSKFIYA